MTDVSDEQDEDQGEVNGPPPHSPVPGTERRLIDRRQIWAAYRFWMEIDNMKTRRYGNRSRHGLVGILGNHDDCHMVNPMEKMGIRMRRRTNSRSRWFRHT